jgi:diguanylate cyclase (GGDEF)-like protein
VVVGGTGMNDLVETWKTAPSRPKALLGDHAILVHIYPPGTSMGARYVLADRPLVIGRGNHCDIRIDDSSVSRHHARIDPEADGYAVFDLQSTNGTYVNDTLVNECRLHDGDYLRIGNCIYRFLSGDNVEAAYHEEIYRRTIVDALTDIHNKRFLTEHLERELARSTRFHRPLALVMFDIDHFKTINDQMGHLAGDFTLRELAACVKTAIRKEEEFARYGGDEFVVILPETTREGALIFAERIRSNVEQKRFIFEDKLYPVTVSVGVAVTGGEEKLSATELLARADAKLYEAKEAGRNRVAG